MEYDVGNDEEDIFPEDFRKHVEKENLLCWKYDVDVGFRKYGVCFGTHFYVYKKAYSPDDITSDCKSLVDTLIGFLETQFMAQFWAAEQVVVVNTTVDHTNYRLTTTNHPFLLGNFPFSRPVHEGLCRYRMKTCDVIVPGDGGGGAIGRVFRNKRIEYSPDVAYYSSQEYPLRDVALSCAIKHSIVVPWFDSHGEVVGVIEFVSTQNLDSFTEVLGYFDRYLSSSLGKGVDRCQGLCAQVRDGLFNKEEEDLEKDLFRSALSEIKEVTGVVFKIPNIEIARTWMLCNSCNSLSPCQETWGVYSSMHYLLKDVLTSCILQKGEGVVGKAAKSSHNLVYCENVAKFSIIEYPLAHFARLCNISACFALCLRSSYTGDQVYILEFFEIPGVDLRTMLVPILDLMKRKFRTFKVAYGREELGDKLPLLVTDANSPDKLENSKTAKLNLTLALGMNNAGALELLKNLKRNGGPGESSRQSFVQRLIEESSKSKTDDSMNGLETSTEYTPMEDAPFVSASTVESEFHVTIKANYGEDRPIIFQLSSSSGIDELYRQLSQRVELVDGNYNLKYLDEENDLIELLCDEDLQLYISNSIEHEIFTLTVLIVPK